MGEYADYEIEKEMFGYSDYDENYTYSNPNYKYIPYFYAKRYHKKLGIQNTFENTLNDFITKYSDKIEKEFENNTTLLEKAIREYGSAWYCRFNAYLRNIKKQAKQNKH
jgi:hypothetical protein